jgi:hypothetical protein
VKKEKNSLRRWLLSESVYTKTTFGKTIHLLIIGIFAFSVRFIFIIFIPSVRAKHYRESIFANRLLELTAPSDAGHQTRECHLPNRFPFSLPFDYSAPQPSRFSSI